MPKEFTRAGHEVVTASDGDERLRAVATTTRPFDVIFVDCRHPDSNENPLLAAIREWAPRSSVVLMTLSHTPDVVTEAYRFGVHQVLCKPFDIDDVQNIVAAASSIRWNMRGDFHGSTRCHGVSVSMSMDRAWDRNATGTVDIRDLPAFP